MGESGVGYASAKRGSPILAHFEPWGKCVVRLNMRPSRLLWGPRHDSEDAEEDCERLYGCVLELLDERKVAITSVEFRNASWRWVEVGLGETEGKGWT